MAIVIGTLCVPAIIAAELVVGESLWIQAATIFSSTVFVGAAWALLLAIGRRLYPSGVDLLRALGDRDERRHPRLIVAARLAGQAFPHRVRRVWEPSVEEVHADICDVAHRSRSVRMVISVLHCFRLAIAFAACLQIWGLDRPLAGLVRLSRILDCSAQNSADGCNDGMDGRRQ